MQEEARRQSDASNTDYLSDFDGVLGEIGTNNISESSFPELQEY
jgi:hypothetical protein